jgi:hypothetical protein
MFKASNKQTLEDVVILDPKWSNQIDHLRKLDKRDRLVCPGCQQPVRVRAGRKKRWHFAHKHLQDCPLSHEAAIVLEARALLYEWLVGKFKEEAVTLERKVENSLLPRPVDCWVHTESGDIAYWIIPSQVKPRQREALKQTFERKDIQINWLFLSDMLREEKDEPGDVHLTTTEREFMHQSEYNEFIDPDGNLQIGGSLHYLDPTQETLTTFRTLGIVHPPQLYGGRKLVDKLQEVLVHPKTGEFVHPGEHQYLQRAKEQREKIQKRLEELERRHREQMEYFTRFSNRPRRALEDDIASDRVRSSIPSATFDSQEGTCVICGQTKREWGFITHLGKRICKECYRG